METYRFGDSNEEVIINQSDWRTKEAKKQNLKHASEVVC